MEIDVKEYMDKAVDSLRREVAAQRENDWRALDLARENLQLRLDGMNQFREQMNQERDTYVRIDTFRWIVATLLAIITALGYKVLR